MEKDRTRYRDQVRCQPYIPPRMTKDKTAVPPFFPATPPKLVLIALDFSDASREGRNLYMDMGVDYPAFVTLYESKSGNPACRLFGWPGKGACTVLKQTGQEASCEDDHDERSLFEHRTLSP